MGRTSGGVRGAAKNNAAQDSALENYVSGEGMWINQYLRGNGDFGELSEAEKDYLNNLERATSKQLGKDLELFRAADARAVFGDISEQEYDALIATRVYGLKDNYYQKFAESAILKTAGIKVEKGFMSTTKSQSVAEGWRDFTGAEKPIVMKFTAPRTARGKDLGKFDVEGDRQYEVLLGRGQRYKIGNVYGKNGNLYVDIQLL